MNAVEVMAALGGFLAEHSDLVIAIKDAIARGADKASLLHVIRESMIAASDAEMHRELGS